MVHFEYGHKNGNRHSDQLLPGETSFRLVLNPRQGARVEGSIGG